MNSDTTSVQNDGATEDDWIHFGLLLGYLEDLLPIVHDTSAPISERSKIKQSSLGKIPTECGADDRVRGIINWTKTQTTPQQFDDWSKDRRLSLGIRCRGIRWLDIDIENPEIAAEVAAVIARHANLPRRTRQNSAKFAQPFLLEGPYKKRRIVTQSGEAIEFLADRQQIVACGRHKSGARYEWPDGLPDEIPCLKPDAFEALWDDLQQFAAEPVETTSRSEERNAEGAPLTEISDDQIDDLRDALAYPRLVEEAADNSVWSEVGYALLSLGDVGFGLWTEFCAAAPNGEEGDAEDWWQAHEYSETRSDFRHIFTMAQERGWINPGAGRVATVDEFDDLGEIDNDRNPLLGYYAYLPQHQYIERKTRQLFPAASVDGNLRGIKVDELKPSSWLDKFRAVHQMTWDPSHGELVEGKIVAAGGWTKAIGKRVYNTYRPAPEIHGDASNVGLWLKHIQLVYPDEYEHIIMWLAQRVQRPGEKVNHALVLGGAQGIGKDTILEPVKVAIGHWNWQEVSPAQMIGQWNDWVKAVVLRVSEARDLGDIDRYKFYDHSKSYIAAPPDVLRVDEKHLRQYHVMNVMGVVITTNHKTDGIYLPDDDRRHYVAWSPLQRDDFEEGYWNALWSWYADGGLHDVAAYLHQVDLSEFDAKAPPPKTEAFYAIVQANVAPEDVALSGLLHSLGLPDAVTLDGLRAAIDFPNGDETVEELHSLLFEKKARRRVPHVLDRAGYVAVSNPDAKDGLWAVGGKRQAVYARRDLLPRERFRAARKACE